MKKLHLILCAGILALAAVSCKKDAQPVEPAKPMSATEIKQKLANTAVDALNEVDPDNWNAWAQTGLKLYNGIREVEGGNINDLTKDLEEAMTSIVEGDTKTTTTTLIKLSLVKSWKAKVTTGMASPSPRVSTSPLKRVKRKSRL